MTRQERNKHFIMSGLQLLIMLGIPSIGKVRLCLKKRGPMDLLIEVH